MNIESIEQKPLNEHNTVMTRVVLRDVESQCILTRVAIRALGRPGVDTDLTFVGSGEQWTLIWTYPAMPLEATNALITEMIQSI